MEVQYRPTGQHVVTVIARNTTKGQEFDIPRGDLIRLVQDPRLQLPDALEPDSGGQVDPVLAGEVGGRRTARLVRVDPVRSARPVEQGRDDRQQPDQDHADERPRGDQELDDVHDQVCPAGPVPTA